MIGWFLEKIDSLFLDYTNSILFERNTMKLRNGKTTQVLQIPVPKPEPEPVVCKTDDKYREFVDEIRSMLFELDEWDVSTARIGGICEIYKCILASYHEIKDSVEIGKFLLSVKNKTPDLLGQILMFALNRIHDDEIAELIIETKQVMLDVFNMIK